MKPKTGLKRNFKVEQIRQEKKLRDEFNARQTDIENYFMTDVADIVAKYADKRGQEEYKNMKELLSSFMKTMARMTDFESFNTNVDDYNTKLTNLNNKISSLDKYFEINGEFFNEIAKIASDLIRDEMKELEAIILFTKKIGFSKTYNILKFNCKKLMESMFYVLMNSTSETIYTYMQEIENLTKPSKLLMKEKLAIYDSFSIKEPIEAHVKKHSEKIFDYKKMNKISEINGFKEVRQTGDHKIFSNGIFSVSIPQHDLGLGLSCKIQKQIGL